VEGRWVYVIYALGLLVLLWPAARRMPRDTLLRNIAIWLALFALAGAAYKLFGR
jgi:hypothetical protein